MVKLNLIIRKYKILMVILLAFILGFCSIVTQIVLLRELIVVFYGNEISYAIVLGSWLFWISIGSFLASLIINKVRNFNKSIILHNILLVVTLPLILLLIRNARSIFGFYHGQMIDILSIIKISFIFAAPLGLIFGSLYSFFAKIVTIPKNSSLNKAINISNLYISEAIGSVLGGLMFSYVFVAFMNSFQILVYLSVASFIFSLIFMLKKSKNVMAFILFVGMCVFVFVSFNPLKQLDLFVDRLANNQFNLIEVKNSIYGNIKIAKKNDQINFFQNGAFSFATNDDLSSEQAVHYPLLVHPDPKTVLIVGNAVAGPLNEILKYKDVKIDYVDLDPAIIELARKYLPNVYRNALENENVKVHLVDGRFFIRNLRNKYDVIIINLSDPITALINRYFTKEFLSQVSRNMNKDSILAISVSSAENYLSNENVELLRSINSTLKSVFRVVRSVPGETNIFLASNENVIDLNPDLLIKRIKDRDIRTKYVSEYYLSDKLSSFRLDYINKILQVQGQINLDVHPVAYFLNSLLWSSHFEGRAAGIIKYLYSIKFEHLIAFITLIFAVFIVRRRSGTYPIAISIMTTGFSEITFQILIIFAFQSLYGFAYYKIGLIIASFMIGLVFGAILSKYLIKRSRSVINVIYRNIQICIAIYPFVIPILFVVFNQINGHNGNVLFFSTVFALLPVIAGFFGGVQYPLASYMYEQLRINKKESVIHNIAAKLYAADVLGACFGALLSSVFLIPIFGIKAVAFLCFYLNVWVYILLMFNLKKDFK